MDFYNSECPPRLLKYWKTTAQTLRSKPFLHLNNMSPSGSEIKFGFSTDEAIHSSTWPPTVGGYIEDLDNFDNLKPVFFHFENI